MEHGDERLKKDCCHSQDDVSQNKLVKKFLEGFYNYKPLILILIFCALIPLAQIKGLDIHRFTNDFMGYFFIFLSWFKFADLKGFVEGFSTYGLVTKRVRAYGYIYPFIELSLGLGYLSHSNLHLVNSVTLMIMAMSGVGVLKSVVAGQKIRCACLGTALNVPLSTVSLLENFGMGIMAAYKLNLLF